MPLKTRFFRWTVPASVILLAATASVLNAQQPGAETAARAPWQPAYRFEIGDIVEFKFTFTPELDFTAPVRPDGAISFPYLGDVTLLGVTVPALADTLRVRYSTVLQMPDVTIIVRSFQTLRVFVTGEVPAPGRLDFRQGMTISQAVASAGGFLETANRNEIIVLRPATPTALEVMVVAIGTRGTEARDLPLAPNDILVVAKSRIARLGQLVRQYSRDLLPISSLGIFFDLVGSTGASVAVAGQ
jgi:protein involved in polysaccharide export with SLBB domain